MKTTDNQTRQNDIASITLGPNLIELYEDLYDDSEFACAGHGAKVALAVLWRRRRTS
jgi:hypothetical protein